MHITKTVLAVILTAVVIPLTAAVSQPKFRADAKADKHLASFDIDLLTVQEYETLIGGSGSWEGSYAFRVDSVEFDDSITETPVRFHGFRLILADRLGQTMTAQFEIKKMCKIGMILTDIRKDKKKFFAVKIANKCVVNTKHKHNEYNLIDWILEDEYKKTTAYHNALNAKSEPLVKSNISPALFIADTRALPIVIDAEIKLQDYYNYDFENCKESHWSIYIRCDSCDSFSGYIPKTSSDGKKMLELVKDGNYHKVLIKISHPRGTTQGDIVQIEKFEPIKALTK